jgi:hypothetical protein
MQVFAPSLKKRHKSFLPGPSQSIVQIIFLPDSRQHATIRVAMAREPGEN